MAEIKVYTIKETAEILKTDQQTVLSEIEKGNINAFKIVGDWRVTQQSIEDFISGGGSEAGSIKTASKRLSGIKISESAPFQYTWPSGYTEEYPSAYEGTVDKDDFHSEVKVGIGDRKAAGMERKRVTVFLNGRPTVEFAGADDFDKSNLVASVITLPNKKRLKPYQPIPKEYQSFDVRRYDSVVKGPRAATAMAVIAKIDDIETIVAHAVNRAIYRDEND